MTSKSKGSIGTGLIIAVAAVGGLALWLWNRSKSQGKGETITIGGETTAEEVSLFTSLQARVGETQAVIAASENSAIPESQIGTADDPNADAHAQIIFRELARTIPPDTVILGDKTLDDLTNIHALVPTPEQAAAGAVPLAGNYVAPTNITLPGNTPWSVVKSYADQRYNVTLQAPLTAVPYGAQFITHNAKGEVTGYTGPMPYPYQIYGTNYSETVV